jgi:hypothetical protein
VKVSDVLEGWSLRKWTSDDALDRAFEGEPGDLRLQWFTFPDPQGWFRITATDANERGWSTFFRLDDAAVWPALEIKLTDKLRASLREIGGLEIDRGEDDEQP